MVTIYENTFKVDSPFFKEPEFALKRIKDCKSRPLIEMIRICPDKDQRNELKKKLPAVSWSGTFKKRSNDAIESYSRLICLDFDNIEKPSELKAELSCLSYCYACWTSPSGTGVKMLVKVGSDNHKGHFFALQSDHPDIDPSGKDVSRLCYESADPDIFINLSPNVYEKILTTETVRVKTVVTNPLAGAEAYKVVKSWMEKNGNSFSDGNRNVFITYMAMACIRIGLPQGDARMHMYADYVNGSTFKIEEFDGVLDGVYSRYAASFGTAQIQDNKIVYENRELTKEDFVNDEPAKDLITCADIWPKLKTNYIEGVKLADTTYFPGLDKHFKWLRGQLTVLNGYGNYGKTTFLNQLMLIRSIMAGNKWAIFSPEQSPAEFFYQDLIQMYVGKSVMQESKNRMTMQEMEEAHDFINKHFFLIDPTKSPTPEYMIERFFEMSVKHSVDGIVVDPWNQLMHDQNDARDLYLEKTLPKFKNFVKHNNLYLTIIAHPKNPGQGETNPRPSPFQISGGMMWNNKADNIICYHRPNHHTDKTDPTCLFASDKIRLQQIVGIPGEVEMIYDRSTFRFFIGGHNPFINTEKETFNESNPF